MRKNPVHLFAFTLVFASGVALACSGDKNCKDGQCPLKKSDVVSQLQLTGDKAEKVKTIETKHHDEMRALKEEVHNRKQKLMAEHHAEMAKILTEEEMEKVKALKHGHKGCDHDGQPKSSE